MMIRDRDIESLWVHVVDLGYGISVSLFEILSHIGVFLSSYVTIMSVMALGKLVCNL